MNHPIQCQCGALKGHIVDAKYFNHGVCYCKDCQAFAHFLGHPSDVLDEHGGTRIVQVRPADVVFTQGKESLACLRLTQSGLLRWYAACCKTPIGNTWPSSKVAFVGMVHSCLGREKDDAASPFGLVTMRVHTKNARGKVSSLRGGLLSGTMRFVGAVARARISGGYKLTPFFDGKSGAPVVPARVLTPAEHEGVMAAGEGKTKVAAQY